MQIKQVAMFPLELPLKINFKTAHNQMRVRPLTLLAVTMTDGTVGFGEIQSFDDATYASETQTSSKESLPKLIQLLKNKDWQDPREIMTLLSGEKNANFAKAGLEMACWDAYGKSKQLSLGQLMGAKHTTIPVGRVIGLQNSVDETRYMLEQAIADGYRRIKLKMTNAAKIPDLHQFKRDGLIFSVDFNNALEDNEASRDLLKNLQLKGIDLVEEPLKESPWPSYQEIVAEHKSPLLSLDESINGIEDIQMALNQQIADAFTLKPGKMGGIGPTLIAQKQINQSNKLPWIGGMLSSGVGRFVDLAIAAVQPTAIFPADSGPTQNYLLEDIIEEKLVLHSGALNLPVQPGIGVQIKWDVVKKYQKQVMQIF